MTALIVKERSFFISKEVLQLLLFLIILFQPFFSYSTETINPWTGNLFIKETDIEIDAGPVQLKIERTFLNKQSEPGLLGTIWVLNWETTVIQTDSAVTIKEGSISNTFGSTDTKNEFKNSSGEFLKIDGQKRYILYKSNGSISIYNSQGRLIERSDKNKNKILFFYTDQGVLKVIKAPRGHSLTVTSDEAGRINQIMSSTGQVIEYIYTGSFLTGVLVNKDSKSNYVYDEKDRITTIIDPVTGPVSFQYDKTGRVVSRAWVDGGKEFYEFDDASDTIRHINAEGAIVSFTKTNQGKKEEIKGIEGRKTVIEYNDELKPVKIIHFDGSFSSYKYDSINRLKETKDPSGRITQYEYIGNTSFYKSISQGKNNHIEYEYDQKNNLELLKTKDKDILQFTYYPDGQIKTRKGLGFPEQKFTYYADGRLKSLTNALGQVSIYQYDKRGNLIQQTDPADNVLKWEYDEQDRLIRETDAASESFKYAYTLEGNLLSVTDPLGNTVTYEYDKKGRLSTQTDPLGRKSSFQYNPLDQVVCVTDPAGHKTMYQYDQAGSLISHTNPLGASLKYQYNNAGSLSQVSDSSGRKWQYENSKDRLSIKVTDPLGKQTTIAFDPQARIEERIDPSGRITDIRFDEAGNIIQENLPGQVSLNYTYDLNGNISSVKDQKGIGIEYDYDAMGRIVRENYPTGYRVEYEYNEKGSLSRIKDSSDYQTVMGYTPNGLLADITDDYGNTVAYKYDAASRITRLTNPLGHERQFEYNAVGEIVTVLGPEKDTAQVEYDKVGNIKKIYTPTGPKVSFLSDGLGNILEETDPLGKVVKTTYDNTGKVVRIKNRRDQTILLSYDRLGRVSEKKLSNGIMINYSYDDRGNLATIDDSLFPVHLFYDDFDRIIRREYPAIKRSLKYEYNKQGEIVRYTDSEGRVYDYIYDKFHRMSGIMSASKKILGYEYFNNDLPQTLFLGNGIKKLWQYDSQDRPSHIEYAKEPGNPVFSQTISYDAGGNPTKVTDHLKNQTAYQYNKAEQLIREKSPDNLIQFQYQAGGNRSIMKSGNREIKYTYNKADQLLNAGDENFAYDADGNMIRRSGVLGIFQYEYDIENRLISVTLPGGKTVRFGYAPTGERIWREDEDGRIWFVTDGLNLVAQLDKTLSPLRTYYHTGVDSPLVMWDKGKAFFYVTDHIGSVTALADDTGKIIDTCHTDAFGNIKTGQAPVINPFIFTARYYEKSLGLYYYRARFYDPSLGRFLSVDPKIPSPEIPSALNFYAYVKNSPVRYTDPFGLEASNDPGQFTSFNNAPFGVRQFQNKEAWQLPARSSGQRVYHQNVSSYSPNRYSPYLNEPSEGEYLGPVARRRLSLPTHSDKTQKIMIDRIRKPLVESNNNASTQKIRISGTRKNMVGPKSDYPTQKVKIGQTPYNVNADNSNQKIRRPFHNASSNAQTQKVPIPNQTRTGSSPSPLTTGQSSTAPPNFFDVQRPLNIRESVGLSGLGILSAVEMGNRIYHSTDPVQETKNLITGLVKVGTVAAGGTLLVGATPVLVGGLVVSIASHGSDIAELPGEVAGYWQARSEEKEAKQQHQTLMNKLPEALNSANNLELKMVSEMAPLVIQGESICKEAKSEAQKAMKTAQKVSGLLSNIKTDSSEILDAALGDCEKIASIDDELVLLKEKALTKGATQEEIKTLVAKATEKQSKINTYRNKAKQLNLTLKKAVKTKEQISKAADTTAKAKTNFETKMASFSKANELIKEKIQNWQMHITRMRTTFKDAKNSSQKDQLHQKLNVVEALMKTYKIECNVNNEKAVMDKAIEEILIAKFEAEKIINADLEGYAKVLSDCADSKTPDYVKDMKAALTGSEDKEPLQNPKDDVGSELDNGGFEDEPEENVSDNESQDNSSDSGFSDEPDSEEGNAQRSTDDSPVEDSGFRDEPDGPAPNAGTESVTYFDRQWMPRSWSTSGDSREVIVNIFEAASRLGWAEALSLYTSGQSDVGISQHLQAAGDHIKRINQNSFGPHKALQDWKQRQAKLISLAKKITQQSMERRNRHRKGLPNAIKSEAKALLKALSYQGAGSVEQMENCDSHYFRIGYHTAYAAQALAAAEAGANAGGSKAWVRKVTGRANSHAAAARGALQGLRKIGVASGACVDMASIEPMINKAAQGTAFHLEKGHFAEQAWHAEFSALKDGGSGECGGELAGIWRNMEGSGCLIRWTKNGDRYEGRYLNSLWQDKGFMDGQLFAVYKKTGSRIYKVTRKIKKNWSYFDLTVAGNFYSGSDNFAAMTTYKRVSQTDLSKLRITKPDSFGQRFWFMPGEESHGPHDEMPNCSKKK